MIFNRLGKVKISKLTLGTWGNEIVADVIKDAGNRHMDTVVQYENERGIDPILSKS